MNIQDTFELPQVFSYLDALQTRADAMIFSKEANQRVVGAEHLQKTFGVTRLSHSAVDSILKEVHHNYMRLARHVLPLE